MQLPQLEHIIRAAAGITGASRFVVIGSQALLGQFPDPPAELRVSIEVDVFTLRSPKDAELIDGSIGEASPFHQTFGYYAHGVGEETAVLPAGWKDRLISLRNENTGETLHLALLDHQTVLYINIIESQRAIRMGYKIGTRAPVHCTAVGKALIAFQPQEVIEATIAHGLPGRTTATITDPRAFRQELAEVRARGYALEDEEIETGLRSIAAAVRNYSGNVVAAIGIAGPAHRMTKKVLLSYARDLVEAADAVSLRLGYQPMQMQLVHRRA